jgi:hypothetical protein
LCFFGLLRANSLSTPWKIFGELVSLLPAMPLSPKHYPLAGYWIIIPPVDEGAKKLAAKYLGKYRPEILDSKPDPLKDHVPGKDEKAMASISIRAGSAAESRGLNGGSQAPSTITAE